MSLVVVDVSVAAKWFLPGSSEALRDEAFALLDKHDRGGIQFVVPDLFCVEIASAIWKAVRLGRLSKASGLNALELLKQREFPTVPSLKLLDRAFQIAMEYQRTVCDCLYVVLATIPELSSSPRMNASPTSSLRTFPSNGWERYRG